VRTGHLGDAGCLLVLLEILPQGLLELFNIVGAVGASKLRPASVSGFGLPSSTKLSRQLLCLLHVGCHWSALLCELSAPWYWLSAT
jgi:hypothetical protein